jgi:hypothetical protein
VRTQEVDAGLVKVITDHNGPWEGFRAPGPPETTVQQVAHQWAVRKLIC